MAITIYDVAREAGFSHTAVAAVLAGRQAKLRISDASAARIRAAAERLGYRSNAIAQAFIRGKTNVVGLVLSSPRREFLGKVLAGAMAAANERGLLLKTISTEEGGISLAGALEQCLRHQVAGVLCCDLQVQTDLLPVEMGKYTPVCWINCSRTSVGTAIEPDDRAGAAAAVEHLVSLGHRRIAFVAGLSGTVGTVDRRREGFVAEMRRRKLALPAGFVVETDWRPESTRSVVRELLGRKDRPTAIMCANDPRAGHVLHEAYALGISVPDQLSVIGFSDDTLSRYTQPPLTTVRQPHAQLGRTAIGMLADAVEGKSRKLPREILLSTELVVRQSTAPLR